MRARCEGWGCVYMVGLLIDVSHLGELLATFELAVRVKPAVDRGNISGWADT